MMAYTLTALILYEKLLPALHNTTKYLFSRSYQTCDLLFGY